jgi:hypothetical protein
MRLTKLTTMLAITAAAATATVPVTAQAKRGADDAPGHVRHSGKDDGVRKSGSKTRTKMRTRARHHGRHGADDGVRHGRHGADDGAGHR